MKQNHSMTAQTVPSLPAHSQRQEYLLWLRAWLDAAASFAVVALCVVFLLEVLSW